MTRPKITKMAFKISARNKSKSAMLIASVGLAIGVSVISNTANAKPDSGEYDLTYFRGVRETVIF
ncbi:hypothetical protein [Photobacterium profundum]|uniref:hypothetical protein n=1 Tax=Photobacterium profundum TaxID=74109 RepID=UPI001E5EDCDB|nr:hypothetical protein [Photobacterium profundum]